MSFSLDRRGFLRRSAMLGGSVLTCGIPLDRSVHAAPARIDAPVIDQLTIVEIIDTAHDTFLSSVEAPGLAVRRTGFPYVLTECGLRLRVRIKRPEIGSRVRMFLGRRSGHELPGALSEKVQDVRPWLRGQ